MLKIGSVSWRARCSRHPTYDPYMDGQGGIRGGCERCMALLEIHEMHQKMLRLMRTFSPPQQKKRVAPVVDDLQESLF